MTTPGVGDPLLITINPLAPYPTQVWSAGVSGQPVLIANLSTTATVYVGYNSSISPSGLNVVPIAPQQAFAFDGSRTIYATALVTAPIIVLPNATQYFSGNISIANSNLNVTVTGGTITATVSGSVSIVGTPTVNIGGTVSVNVTNSSIAITSAGPLDVSAATVNINPAAGFIPQGAIASLFTLPAPQSIAGGSFITPLSLGNVTNYLSYDIVASAYCPAQNVANAPLTMQMTIRFFADSAGTYLIAEEGWEWWIGNASTALGTIFGSGPIRGQYMSVVMGNPGGLSSSTLQTLKVFGTGRTSAFSDLRSSIPTGINGGIQPLFPTGGDSIDNIISAASNFAMGANATNWVPMPTYSGPIFFRYETSALLAHDLVLCSAPAMVNGGLVAGTGALGIIFNVANTAANTEVELLGYAPRAPMYMVVSSTATAPTISYLLIGGKVGP